MKILIVGWGRCGKDDLATMLGLSYRSSSEVVLEQAIWEQWGAYHYDNINECFADRSNHRQVWFDRIQSYNYPDKARLAKFIMKDNECYVGMRCKIELAECVKQDVFDLIIWIDAEGRVPEEKSCTITKAMCDVSFDNKGTLEEYIDTVTKIGHYIEGFRAGLDLGNFRACN